MKYYEFETLPVYATSTSFLIGYNKVENERIFNSGFATDRFGSHDSYTAKLTGSEGLNFLEFSPYLDWASGRPDHGFYCLVIPEIRIILDKFKLPTHKWYKVNVT